jgi:hypothetical protein
MRKKGFSKTENVGYKPQTKFLGAVIVACILLFGLIIGVLTGTGAVSLFGADVQEAHAWNLGGSHIYGSSRTGNTWSGNAIGQASWPFPSNETRHGVGRTDPINQVGVRYEASHNGAANNFGANNNHAWGLWVGGAAADGDIRGVQGSEFLRFTMGNGTNGRAVLAMTTIPIGNDLLGIVNRLTFTLRYSYGQQTTSPAFAFIMAGTIANTGHGINRLENFNRLGNTVQSTTSTTQTDHVNTISISNIDTRATHLRIGISQAINVANNGGFWLHRNDNGWKIDVSFTGGINPATHTFSGGAGTAADPFRIANANDFAMLAYATNLRLGERHNSHYIQTAHINMADRNSRPIGLHNGGAWRGFEGVYDGRGFEIQNMRPLAGDTFVAPFGTVRQNGILRNAVARGTNLANGNGAQVGGLVAHTDSGGLVHDSVVIGVANHASPSVSGALGGNIQTAGQRNWAINCTGFAGLGNSTGGMINATSTAAQVLEMITNWGGNNLTTQMHIIKFGLAVRAGHTLAGNTVLLGASVNMTGWGFAPIGDMALDASANQFSGTFNGNNHRVTFNFETTASNAGFFSVTRGATIRDLIVAGSVSAAHRNGGIVGTAYNTTIVNCTNEATITNRNVDHWGYTGGLVGSGNNTTIENSTNSGNVVVQGAINNDGGIGGFVGLQEGAPLTIRNSTNSANITRPTGGTHSGTGGFVGVGGTVWDSVNTGTLNVGANAGGIIGSGGTVHNSRSSGNITGTNAVGGIAGHNSSVFNSFSHGNITASGNQAGGIAGLLIGSNRIENSYSYATVRANTNSAGGIVGHVDGASVRVTNNVALNPRVSSGGTSIGRVAGAAFSGTLINNFGFTWMFNHATNNTHFSGNVGANANSGADATIETIYYSPFWRNLGFSASIWATDTARLPVLQGSPLAFPAHLQPTNLAGATVNFVNTSRIYNGVNMGGFVQSVVLNSNTLVANRDFSTRVVSEDNVDNNTSAGVNVGQVTVEVKGRGNYYTTYASNSTYTITPIQVVLQWGTTTFVYNGLPQRVAAPTLNPITLVAGDVVNITLDSHGDPQVNVGSWTTTAIATDNRNYTVVGGMNRTNTWHIVPIPYANVNLNHLSYAVPTNHTFIGLPFAGYAQGFEVSFAQAGTVNDTSYPFTSNAAVPFTIYYALITGGVAGTPSAVVPSDVGSYRVSVSIPQGNFTAKVLELPEIYTISKQGIDVPTVTNRIFNRSDQNAGNFAIGTEHFTVVGDVWRRNVGDYEISLILRDPANFKWNDSGAEESGTRELQWHIETQLLDISVAEFSFGSTVFDNGIELIFSGETLTPVITLRHLGDELLRVYATTDIIETTEYVLTFSTSVRTNVSTYTITVSFVNNYHGGFTKDYSIIKNTPVLSDINFTPIPTDHAYMQGTPQGIGAVTDATSGGFLGAITVFYDGIATAPELAGTYTVVVVIDETPNFNGATFVLGSYTIAREVVTIPIVSWLGLTVFDFNGSYITPVATPPSPHFELSGDLSRRNAGEYVITVTLIDNVNRVWSNGESSAIDYEWEIRKIQSVARPQPAATWTFITASLPALTLMATDSPGEVEWDEVDEIKAGLYQYGWTFTPADPLNFTTVTGFFTIEGRVPVISRVELVQGPTVTEYKAFEQLNPSGIIIRLFTNNNEDAGIIDFTNEDSFSITYQQLGNVRNSFRVGDSTVFIQYLSTRGMLVTAPNVQITGLSVTRADPVVVAPTNLTATFGDNLDTVLFDNTNYLFGWTWVSTGLVGNAGQNEFVASFAPDDYHNLNTLYNIKVFVDVAKLGVVAPVALTGFVYNGQPQNVGAWHSGTGLFSTSGDLERQNATLDAGNPYVAVVTLIDPDNHFWLTGDALVAYRNISWTIAPKVIVAANVTAIAQNRVYNGGFDVAIAGLFNAGVIYSGDNVNINLTGARAVADAGAGVVVNILTWLLSGDDAGNYVLNEATFVGFTTTVNVAKAMPRFEDLTFNIPTNHFYTGFGLGIQWHAEAPHIGTIVAGLAGFGAITIFYEGLDINLPYLHPRSSALPVNAGFYEVSVDIAESGNWLGATIVLGQYRIRQATPVVNVNITRPPTIFTTGQLPNITTSGGDTAGTIEWNSYTLTAGNHRFYWTFTPTDTQNFSSFSNSATFTITTPPLLRIDVKGALLNTTYVAFETLNLTGITIEIIYDDGKNSVAGVVDFSDLASYTIIYPTGNSLRYGNTSVVISYRGLTQTIGGFTVGKANPVVVAPTNLTATFGDNLSTVLFDNSNYVEGFAWVSTGLVGDAGLRTFVASFTPNDLVNFNVLNNINVTITVNRRGIAVPTAVTDLVYTGAVQTGVAAGANYTIANNTATNAGNFVATATISDFANNFWNDGGANVAERTVGFTIAKRALINIAFVVNNRQFDGTVNAVATALDLTTANGLVAGELVGVSITAAFNTRDVGNNKPVTVTAWELIGADSDNYVLPLVRPTATGDIYRRSVTNANLSIEPINRPYDHSGSLHIEFRTVIDNLVVGDVVNAVVVGHLESHLPGAHSVIITSLTLAGRDAGNYLYVDDFLAINLTATVQRRTPTVADFDFEIPTHHVFLDSNTKGIGAIGARYDGMGGLAVLYRRGIGFALTNEIPTDAGSYTVVVRVEGGQFYFGGDVIIGTYTIARAQGLAVVVEQEIPVQRSADSINVHIPDIVLNNQQTVEFAIVPRALLAQMPNFVPVDGWGATPRFEGLQEGTEYVIFIRSQENGSFYAGKAEQLKGTFSTLTITPPYTAPEPRNTAGEIAVAVAVSVAATILLVAVALVIIKSKKFDKNYGTSKYKYFE